MAFSEQMTQEINDFFSKNFQGYITSKFNDDKGRNFIAINGLDYIRASKVKNVHTFAIVHGVQADILSDDNGKLEIRFEEKLFDGIMSRPR